MITKEEVLLIHIEVIKRHGGANGIRDFNLLESAISRPYASFDGIDLYQSGYAKAAAIGQSIIINHPFIDGNKRTGYVLMETLLNMEEKVKTNAVQNEKYQFVMDISTGKLEFDDIVLWLKENSSSI